MINIPSPTLAQAFLVYEQLTRLQTASYDAIQASQLEQLRRLITHAQKTSPFWQARFGTLGVDPSGLTWDQFQCLPMLTRQEIQRNVTQLRSNWSGRQPQHIRTVSTSGSTSQPIRVEQYRPVYEPIYAAVAHLEDIVHRRDASKTLLVSKSTSVDHQQVGWTSMHLFDGRKGLGLVRAREQRTAAEHVDWIVKNKPTYMVTNALFAAELAQDAMRRGIDYRFAQITSQAENVTERHRQLVRDGFGCEIADRYSCEELGWLALQCPDHQHYHVVSPSVIIEIVDAHNKPCPPGVMGRVLVTGLFSYAMPLIRYELGDLAEWGTGDCSCGSRHPVIKRLHGRIRHLFESASGQKMPLQFLGIYIGEIESIKSFQVKQYSDKTLEIDIELYGGLSLSEEDERLIRTVFNKRQCEGLPLHVNVVDRIDWGPGFKREEFIRVDAPYAD